MIKADKIHKDRVLDILSECFEQNKTVNWIVKQDEKRKERIRYLMDYSFDTCLEAGQIYLTTDLNGVIIFSASYNKLPILKEAYLTLQYVWKVTGVEGIGRALKREDYINRYHPTDTDYIYIWFIAVHKSQQGRGIGSAMVNEVIARSEEEGIPVYVETSTEINLHFYQRFGFTVFHTSEKEFGFKLYFLRRLPGNDLA